MLFSAKYGKNLDFIKIKPNMNSKSSLWKFYLFLDTNAMQTIQRFYERISIL